MSKNAGFLFVFWITSIYFCGMAQAFNLISMNNGSIGVLQYLIMTFWMVGCIGFGIRGVYKTLRRLELQ